MSTGDERERSQDGAEPPPPESFARVDQLCVAVTIGRAAEMLGVSESEVEALIAEGRLRPFRLPGSGRIRIAQSDVEELRAELRGSAESDVWLSQPEGRRVDS